MRLASLFRVSVKALHPLYCLYDFLLVGQPACSLQKSDSSLDDCYIRGPVSISLLGRLTAALFW